MKAKVLEWKLAARRDVRFGQAYAGGARVAECGPWRYTARLYLECDREFWDRLDDWLRSQGAEGLDEAPALPADEPSLPPASSPMLPPAPVDGELVDEE